ncbi:MAG: pentapeptide repeat-containing protein [Mycobacterium sp.]|nr:pentapeptide repeat-containing protein [Mycobacterium sp.]
MADRKKADPLIKAVAWAVVIGILSLGGLALAAHLLKWEGFWRGAGQPYATTLAALAAISAAAIALHNGRSQLEELRTQRDQDQKRYEEQRDRDQGRYEDQRDRDQARYEEQRDQDQLRWADQRRRDDIKDLRTRFTEASEQLASELPAVRRSGAYAMASLVRDWRQLDLGSEAKVCLQVLGAYVKSPNPTLVEPIEPGRKADPGPDGPLRSLIVELICGDALAEFDSWPGACDVIDYADLRSVDFNGTLKAAVSFVGVRGEDSSFINADLVDGMNFNFAKLNRAWFLGVNLRNTQFEWASLRGAHFGRADVRGANFRFASLQDAEFENAIYDDKTIWPEGFEPPADAVKDAV